MRKIRYTFVIISLTALMSLPTFGQGTKFELGAMMGYQFGGRLNYYEGELKIRDAGNWMVFGNAEVAYNTAIEFSYSSMTTTATFTPYKIGYDYQTFDLRISYFQLEALNTFARSDKLEGFGLFGLGAMWNQPLDDKINDVTRFSMSLGLGGKIYFTDRIGIRLQGRLLMPMYFGGVGAYCGIGTGGSGCGLSLNSWVPIVQGDFSGGIFFVIGQ